MYSNMALRSAAHELVAQLDRVFDYESKGRGFESLRARQRKVPENKGLIVIRYYLALRGAENGVTAMVTPFFCVQG